MLVPISQTTTEGKRSFPIKLLQIFSAEPVGFVIAWFAKQLQTIFEGFDLLFLRLQETVRSNTPLNKRQ